MSAGTFGGPVAPTRSVLRPLSQHEVRIVGGFWSERQTINARNTLAHCLTWMERIGWTKNFDRVADGTVAENHAGIEFVDSEVYKLLEAIAWELGRGGDADLERTYQDLVVRVAAAQDDDGYLHTSFGRPGQPARYSDLEWGHELYCFGHLIQAAVARARTGHQDDPIVTVARRLADHVYTVFGPAGRDAICGHPEIEPALVELGRTLDEPRYIELARLFVERRGHRTLQTTLFQGSDYFQDDVPVREATVLRGHAVRAMYLSAGALDVATETDDEDLAAALERQWESTTRRRTYITGAIGSHHQNEAFGDDYELPPDRAYAETCAGIASIMFNWRLLLRNGDPKYADLLERTLLNNVLASPREDGRAFFYTNTLHRRVAGTPVSDHELSERAESSLRAPWFEVSCCPTNVARLLASVDTYFATADTNGIQIHQYGDVDIRTEVGDRPVALTVRSGYPFDGRVLVTVDAGEAFELTLRLPAWARGRSEASLNGQGVSTADSTVTVTVRAGDQVELTLPMVPRLIYPDRRIDAVRGSVAVERGPLVLCLESTDLPDAVDLNDVVLDMDHQPQSVDGGARIVFRESVPSISEDWPYGASMPESGVRERFSARLIPYFHWANRGPSTMRVWIPIAQ